MDITLKIDGFEQVLGERIGDVAEDPSDPILIGELWIEAAGRRAMVSFEMQITRWQHKELECMIAQLRRLLMDDKRHLVAQWEE